MQTARKPVATRIPTTRSKISNGTRLLENVDGRSSSARRFRDLVQAFEGEIGGTLTEVEKGLVRQAAGLQLRAEQMQADIVNGKPVDSDALIRVSSTSKRILESIGARATKRKPATPTLQDHLRQRAAERADAGPGSE
jgi:hypothetical protein